VKKSEKTNFSSRARSHARQGHAPDLLALGERVRATRVEAGLTQDQLALASGVSRDTVIAVENGRGSVRLGNALRVLKALGLHFVTRERG
jgi:y4mF family transcriptional regulator